MGRWDPDAGGRLQEAAAALYTERGYDDVTVHEIATAAGLTKRTFFRYFPDKREVLFAGAQALQNSVVAAVLAAAAEVAPIDAAVTALAGSEGQLAKYGAFARWRRDLIASSTDLQERELIKIAALTAGVANALRQRGVDPAHATLTAHAAVSVFTIAYDRWVDGGGTADLAALMRQSLADLRSAISAG